MLLIKLTIMTFKTAIPILIFSFLLIACSKEDDETAEIMVQLTDAPGDYDQVNIDLKEVILKTNSSSNPFNRLATQQGIYDLLLLQNGIDTLIASGTTNGDVLKEVRLVLGSKNTVMVDSVLYDLTIPSASESGLKIKIDKDLNATINTLIVDFDAGLSIHEKGSGEYQLRPVIKVK